MSRPKTRFICQVCAKEFIRKPSRNRGEYIFCSQQCFRQAYQAMPLAERFWPKIQKTDNCWLWTGAKNDAGYGIIRLSSPRKNERAHRIAWTLTFGPIPLGMQVLHHGDNRAWVRPEYLFLGDPAANARDKMNKGRARGLNGSACARAKFTEAQVISIRRDFERGMTRAMLVANYRINRDTLNGILARETWRHI